jgi:hypothetical protein
MSMKAPFRTLAATLPVALSVLIAVPAATAAPAATAKPVSPAVSQSILGRALNDPRAFPTAAGLYVSWQTSAPGTAEIDELAHVNAATGAVEAEHYLGAQLGTVLSASGSLWVSIWSAKTGPTVLRLNPGTLAVTERLVLGRAQAWIWSSAMTVAGGALWVAAGSTLVRVSLPAGRVTARVSVPHANSIYLTGAATGNGDVLVDGEANDGLGAVQVRDPRTGAVRASAPMLGVVAPAVAGRTGSVWVSEPTGMMGHVELLSLPGLKPERLQAPAGDFISAGRTTIGGTNGISAFLADGHVWLTQPEGGPRLNYCGDPATGRMLAAIPLPRTKPGPAEVLAVGSRYIYFTDFTWQGSHAVDVLGREPIPAAC